MDMILQLVRAHPLLLFYRADFLSEEAYRKAVTVDGELCSVRQFRRLIDPTHV